jgi:hypothetical protein
MYIRCRGNMFVSQSLPSNGSTRYNVYLSEISGRLHNRIPIFWVEVSQVRKVAGSSTRKLISLYSVYTYIVYMYIHVL